MCAAMTGREAYRVMFRDYPDVVTVEQMSQMLGISDKTAYALLRDNKIEHFKVGRTYKIPKIHILSYLKVIQRAYPYHCVILTRRLYLRCQRRVIRLVRKEETIW